MKPQVDVFARETLHITSVREADRHYYICWRPSISCFHMDERELLRWCKWPPKTPTGDALREWLAALPRSADGAK